MTVGFTYATGGLEGSVLPSSQTGFGRGELDLATTVFVLDRDALGLLSETPGVSLLVTTLSADFG